MTRHKRVPSSLPTTLATLDANELQRIRGGAEAFASVSNVENTRHDTAKNSIGNIR